MTQDRYTEAYNITKEIMARGDRTVHPYPRILRTLLQRLARQGGIKELEDIRSLFTDELLRMTAFDNTLCSAYVFSGRAADYLEKLETQDPGEVIPLGGLRVILENCPELSPRVVTLAKKCAREANNLGPTNILWIEHFMKGEYKAADAIVKEFPAIKDNLTFGNILHEARVKQDEVMSERMVTMLWDHSSHRVRGAGCSTHIDVLVSNRKLDEAEKFLADIQKRGVQLSDLNVRSLENMRKEFTLAGREPPFQSPEGSNST